ncbi:MAG: VOC family protein [Candidatus Sericytochromatia bacterium]
MTDDLAFHHMGLACRDLDTEIAAWAILGYRLEGSPFEDPIQRVRGCFVVGAGPRLELLMPLDDTSPVMPWLAKGVKFYHQAFETVDIRRALDTLKARRGKVVVPPTPAVAFQGREIAFVLFPNMMLIELIQAAERE